MKRPAFHVPLPGSGPGEGLDLGERTLIMGVLNVTPDSFSDGGDYLNPQAAIARAQEMEREGADLVDIGGESTRPGSARVSAGEELHRILPVVEGLRGVLPVPISVDTYKPEVAERAVAAGARLINCVALGDTRDMARVAARTGAALVLMHVRGQPETMHRLPPLADVLGEVTTGLQQLQQTALEAGLPSERLLLDPGFGFGKNGEENYELLAGLSRLHALGRPLITGTSRKAFIGNTLGAAASERIFGTAATVTAAVLAGVHIVRVHDVAAMVQVVRVADAIRGCAKMSYRR